MPNHCLEYIPFTKLHYFNLFTMTFDVYKPVLMTVSAFATHQNTTAKSSLRSKYNGFRGDGGLSETLLKSRVCEVNTMVSGGRRTLRNTILQSRVCEVNTMVSGPPMSLNSCSFYCCFTVVIYVVFRVYTVTHIYNYS